MRETVDKNRRKNLMQTYKWLGQKRTGNKLACSFPLKTEKLESDY